MTTEIISTTRLSLRSPVAGDFQKLYECVFSDADVMRFVLGGVALAEDQARSLFASAFDHEGTGLKLGTLVERAGGDIIGFSGLMECSALGAKDYEIGFVLRRAAWGRGYATEIGQGQLEYGFNVVGCARLLAQVAPENRNSIATLNKIGMAYHR